jgi:hypothetical protein
MSGPNYAREANEAEPVKGGCFSCDATWVGAGSRASANAHRDETRHAIWVECKPRDAQG